MSDKDNDEASPPEQPTVCSLNLCNKTVSAYILNEVADALKGFQPGDSLSLETDSYTGLRHDLLAWGRLSGNDIRQVVPHKDDNKEEQEAPLGGDRYIITKTADSNHPPKERMAVVITSKALDDLISPLGFALAGASAGMEVALFFQGPGVQVLRKGFQGRLSGMQAPFSAFARRGMAGVGHDPPAVKLRQLHDLGAKFYVCHPSLDHFGVNQSQLAFDDVILAEYVTFLEAMRNAAIQMYP